MKLDGIARYTAHLTVWKLDLKKSSELHLLWRLKSFGTLGYSSHFSRPACCLHFQHSPLIINNHNPSYSTQCHNPLALNFQCRCKNLTTYLSCSKYAASKQTAILSSKHDWKFYIPVQQVTKNLLSCAQNGIVHTAAAPLLKVFYWHLLHVTCLVTWLNGFINR